MERFGSQINFSENEHLSSNNYLSPGCKSIDVMSLPALGAD